MNALRSAPFLPVACLLHSRIRSYCEIAAVFCGVATGADGAAFAGVVTAAGLAGVATGSAACAANDAASAASAIMECIFIVFSRR